MRITNYCCCTTTIHCYYCVKRGNPVSPNNFELYKKLYHGLTQKERINELESLHMNDTLKTQAAFKIAIRAKQYIVGSVVNGGMSFSAYPKPHNTRAEARAECNRLAKANPGKLYIFVCLEGGEFLPQAVAPESI